MKIKFGLLPRIILAILLGVALGSFVPEIVVRYFATFNSLFGGFLGFAIPLIIIGFIVPGIAHLGKGAGKLLGITATTAYISTIIAGSLAFTVGTLLLPGFIENTTAGNVVNPGEALLSGLFELEIAPIMGVMTALIFSFVLGIGISSTNSTQLRTIMDEFQRIIEKLITYVIIPLLPLHILGIFMNMTYGGQVQSILSVFAKVFIMIIALHLTMLLLQYTIAGISSGKIHYTFYAQCYQRTSQHLERNHQLLQFQLHCSHRRKLALTKRWPNLPYHYLLRFTYQEA